MSEYQYYEFLALDHPLDDRQLDELRALSTRADITPTSFVNEYHWGDFHGDPRTLMHRYFDAHLYLASWGTHHLMIKLSARLLALDTARQYCPGDYVGAWSHGGHVILSLTSEDESGDWDGTNEIRLGSIVGIRAELAAGDLRSLYLAWLLCAQTELDDDAIEPPVPANLASLTAAQRGLADFLRVDEDLLSVAAATSEQSEEDTLSDRNMANWIDNLPTPEKNRLLLRVMRGDDPHLRGELLRRFRSTIPTATPVHAQRTVGELLAAAQAQRTDRERLAEQRRAKERARREQQAAIAREKRLDELAAQEQHAWAKVSALIDTKRPQEYDNAVALITDLRAVADRNGQPEVFDQRYQQLRQNHRRKPSLIDRLDRAGLDIRP